MKILWNKKYNTVAVYACASAFIIIAAVCVFVNFSEVRGAYHYVISVLSPVLWGFSFAYLLFPLYKYFRDRVYSFVGRNKPRPRLRKALAIISAYLCVVLFLTVFMLFIVPQIANSYADLQTRVGAYFTTLQEWLEKKAAQSDFFSEQYKKLLDYVDIEKLSANLQEFVTGSFDVIVSGTSYVFGFLGGVVTQIANITLGLVISVYLILWKEKLAAQAKKLMNAIFSRKAVERIFEVLRNTDRTFGGFIVGKLIDSLIIGILTFVVLGLFDIPYYPLVSVIVGVTNVIPFFGPFIGAIPSAFIIFVADPMKALWFVVLIIIIQQLDGNIIGPRILGNTTGLDALWVIIAIIVMSGLLGVVGMFIGVPVFAVLYSLIKEAMEARLKRRGLPVSTESYFDGGEPDGMKTVNIDRRYARGENTPDDAEDDPGTHGGQNGGGGDGNEA